MEPSASSTVTSLPRDRAPCLRRRAGCEPDPVRVFVPRRNGETTPETTSSTARAWARRQLSHVSQRRARGPRRSSRAARASGKAGLRVEHHAFELLAVLLFALLVHLRQRADLAPVERRLAAQPPCAVLPTTPPSRSSRRDLDLLGEPGSPAQLVERNGRAILFASASCTAAPGRHRDSAAEEELLHAPVAHGRRAAMQRAGSPSRPARPGLLVVRLRGCRATGSAARSGCRACRCPGRRRWWRPSRGLAVHERVLVRVALARAELAPW